MREHTAIDFIVALEGRWQPHIGDCVNSIRRDLAPLAPRLGIAPTGLQFSASRYSNGLLLS